MGLLVEAHLKWVTVRELGERWEDAPLADVTWKRKDNIHKYIPRAQYQAKTNMHFDSELLSSLKTSLFD